MDQNYIREKIYLAALLHDIGKFYQRYDQNNSHLKDNIKNLEDLLCPYNNYYYSHKHVLWTAQFFDDNRGIINKIFGLPTDDDSIMMLASSHHKPRSEYIEDLIIQKADVLSSMAEREKKSKDDDTNTKTGYYTVPLVSLFDLVKLDAQSNVDYPKSAKQSIETKPLTIKQLFFEKGETYTPNYSTMWEQFITDFKKIPTTLSPQNFVETLDALMHRYMYCIPSSTIDEPDISLYDHLKTTAFIAISLYDYISQKKISNFNFNDDTQVPFVLLGGDISGIQDFIYNIPSKGAAKQLKARSFYIHLLTSSVVRFVLKKFNLLKQNIVYSSGGNFYIFLPNVGNIDEKILEISTEINQFLQLNHGTNLYFALSYEYLSFANFQKKDGNDQNTFISDIWERLISEKLSKAKNQRYLYTIQENYDQFFNPSFSKIDEDGKFDKIFLNLGQNLRKSKYLVFSQTNLKNYDEKYLAFDFDFGIKAYLFDSLNNDITNCEIIKFNDTNIVDDIKANNSYNFEFYGGNNYPTSSNGEPKTLEDLAEGKSLDRIGILRMDVDNLGKIFACGFAPNLRTFSRLTALSRNLDFFFKGYLNTIWDNEKLKNDTYILYSGGDDLFIVGKWNKVFDLAVAIKKKFDEFTASSQFGISGGMVIARPKQPIRRCAHDAGEQQNIAKNFERNLNNKKTHKNSFAFFNMPFCWNKDVEKIIEIKNNLYYFMSKNNNESTLPRALINNIILFSNMQEKQLKHNEAESWRWLLTYNLHRLKKRVKGKDAEDFIENTKISIFTDKYNFKEKNFEVSASYPMLKIFAISARLAELELRTEE